MLEKTTRRAAESATAEQTVLFNYSEEEWLEIEAATQPIRKGALPEKARKHLIGEAHWYLAQRPYPRLNQQQRAWQKIALQVERSRQTLSVLAEQHIQLLKNAGYTKSQASARRDYSNDLDALSELRDKAQRNAELGERSPPDAAHYDNPKFMYEFQVLRIWTVLGGELRISRHPKTGKIQGPLARFFRAVTVPVMGVSAPSPESLPDIVRRQKRFVAFEKTFEESGSVNDLFDLDGIQLTPAQRSALRAVLRAQT